MLDRERKVVDLMPKGIEIRTPVYPSIGTCLDGFRILHERLQARLLEVGYRAVVLSFHPTEDHFGGPPSSRRSLIMAVGHGGDDDARTGRHVGLPRSLADQLAMNCTEG